MGHSMRKTGHPLVYRRRQVAAQVGALLHASNALVNIGFERVAYQVKVQDVQEHDSERASDWRINDISATGMGLTFIGKAVEQLAIGRVILVKAENHPLLLGVIRRILRQSNGTKVGIEILGQSPVGVSLLTRSARSRRRPPRSTSPSPIRARASVAS